MKTASKISRFIFISKELTKPASLLFRSCLIILTGICLLGSCEQEGDFSNEFPSMDILGSGPFTGEYWPTGEWRSCAPEEVGMDSYLLRKMNEDMVLQMRLHIDVHSVHVIRKGYIVAEQYYNPDYTADSTHYIFSCTKSVLSAAFGVAREQGFFSNLDTALFDFFPEYPMQGQNLKKQITLRHALMMSDGLEWYELQYPYGDERNTFYQWRSQGGENSFILDRPVSHEPGTRYNYNSGISQLLSVIFSRETGLRLDSFVHQEIFTPLGISDYQWQANTDMITKGYSGLYLRPGDLAKFGWLYLKKGVWEDRQLVPSAWVEESTARQIYRGDIPGFYYGYQWWVHQEGLIAAVGFAGQLLIIIPEDELVVVFNNYHNELDDFQNNTPWRLLTEFIIPAIID